MLRLLATLSLLASAVIVSPPSAADRRPGHKVGIDVLNVTGSGCKQGTAEVAMSADNSAFTVVYSEYLARAGAGAGKKDASKDCRIKLRVHPVAGYTHSISQVDHRGFAILPAGATARQLASYYFQGSGQTPDRTRSYTGPYDDTWLATDVTAAMTFGPCGASRHLNIATALHIDATGADPAATSMMGMDSADAELATTYRLAWRSC